MISALPLSTSLEKNWPDLAMFFFLVLAVAASAAAASNGEYRVFASYP